MSIYNHNDYIATRAGVMAAALSSVSAGFTAMTTVWNKRSEQRRLVAELSKLTDRELADIGLQRADIGSISLNSVHGEGQRSL